MSCSATSEGALSRNVDHDAASDLRAVGVCPDRTTGYGPDVPLAVFTSGRGASWRTTWAFVPAMPNELVPAIAGTPAGQPRSVVLTSTPSSFQGICGFGVTQCKLGGIWPCFSESAT